MRKETRDQTKSNQGAFEFEPTSAGEAMQEVPPEPDLRTRTGDTDGLASRVDGDKTPSLDSPIATPLRDDAWLAERVRLLWDVHFADVARGYPIVTRFSTRAQYRFGSIAARSGRTIILINRLFANAFVPEYVVDATLGHELAHYAHGFGSGLPQLYADAHRGGVVDRELERRGLGEISERAEAWRKQHWATYYSAQCADLLARREARGDDAQSRWDAILHRADSRREAELKARCARIQRRLEPHLSSAASGITVEWLAATVRQTAPSYWYAGTRTLRIHGLLCDRRVPDAILDFELAYWLTRLSVGARWQSIHAILAATGMAPLAEEALTWRRRRWNAFLTRNHPLRNDAK